MQQLNFLHKERMLPYFHQSESAAPFRVGSKDISNVRFLSRTKNVAQLSLTTLLQWEVLPCRDESTLRTKCCRTCVVGSLTYLGCVK